MSEAKKIIQGYIDRGIIREAPLTWQQVNGMVITVIAIITIVFGICFAILTI